ncbi:hypothetical protein [Acidithiobacillus sulfuriphilus]|uniref:hypothetical protein n=1 Tax=Acidithiobacillus sulfuriphilus TaxID=1867749 RepID=UPI003F5D75A4
MHLIIDARLEQPHPFLRIRGRYGATRLHLDGHVLERLVAALRPGRARCFCRELRLS